MKKIFLFVFMILWTGSISFAQGVYSIVPPQFQTSSSCQTSSTNGANIFIKTNPAHASLYINHVYVGETPICVSNLAPGTYLFRLSASHQYLPFEANIEVLQNQNQTFSWKIHLLSPVFETKLMPQGNNASTLYVRIERKAEAWLKAGIEAMKKDKLEEAERDFQLAATGKPQGLPIGYALLGMLYKQQGKTKEAVAGFRQYLFFNPHSSAAYNELGKLYETLGEEQKALTAYKLAVINLPQYANVLAQKPSCTWKKINELETAVKKNPDDWTSRIQLGYLYEQKGRLLASILQFKRILQHEQAYLAQQTASWQTL
jgi:tetratricopeptide (TPR) repeat protein